MPYNDEFTRGGGWGGDSHIKRAGCSSGNFKLTPKRYQSGRGLSGTLPLKGTNQKHTDKQLVQ